MKSWLGRTIASLRSAEEGKITWQWRLNILRRIRTDPPKKNDVHESFFDCCFLALGQLSKADGSINSAEIQFAQQLMQRMDLSEKQRLKAMNLFNQGKQAGFDLATPIRAMQKRSGGSISVANLLVEILLQAAYCDQEMNHHERLWLQRLSHWLNMNQVQFGYLHQKVQAQMQVKKHSQQGAKAKAQVSLAEHFQTLGLPMNASLNEVRLAYKRKIGQYHPDKLSGMQLSPEFIALYDFKAKQVRAAYDFITAFKAKQP